MDNSEANDTHKQTTSIEILNPAIIAETKTNEEVMMEVKDSSNSSLEKATDEGCKEQDGAAGVDGDERPSGKENEKGAEEEKRDEEKRDEEKEEDEEDTKPTTAKEAEFTSEIFKILLKNLPKYFGYKQLRKMIEGLNLKPKKVKPVKEYAFITFGCEEDKLQAMTVLNKHTWKGRRLVAKLARANEDPMVAHKRKQETEDGDRDRQGKKQKADCQEDESLPVEERLNNAVTPLWKVPYEEQLNIKMKKKKEVLRRLSSSLFTNIPETRSWVKEQQKNNSGMCCPLEDIMQSPLTTGYRNKCEFSIGTSPDGEEKTVGFRLGLYKGGQISVVNPSTCLHVPDTSKMVVEAFQGYIRQSSLPAYDPMTHEGHWRMLTVRTTKLGGVMAIVTFHRQTLSDEDVEKEKQRVSEFFLDGGGVACGVTSIYIHVQCLGDNKALTYTHLGGEEHITDEVLQLKFRISPEAFFQVNTPAAEVLYQTIGDWAEVNKTTTLLDICCGTGTIGISLAKRVEKVIGVEMNQQAIEDAKVNAALNNVDNIAYHCGKAEDLLPDITNHMRPCFDVVGIVDPPRAGLHPRVVEAIRRCPRLNRLVYVSCDAQQAIPNFMNLCRPTSKKRKGVPFRLIKAVPVDLFPHTSHCELVLLFQRNIPDGSSSSSAS